MGENMISKYGPALNELVNDEDQMAKLRHTLVGTVNTLMFARSIRRSAAVLQKLRASEPLTKKDARTVRTLILTGTYAIVSQAALARRSERENAHADRRLKQAEATAVAA